LSALLLARVYYLFSVALVVAVVFLLSGPFADAEAPAAAVAAFSRDGFLEVPFYRAQMK